MTLVRSSFGANLGDANPEVTIGHFSLQSSQPSLSSPLGRSLMGGVD